MFRHVRAQQPVQSAQQPIQAPPQPMYQQPYPPQLYGYPPYYVPEIASDYGIQICK